MNVKYNKDMKNITIRKNKNGQDIYLVQIRKRGNSRPSKSFKTLKEAKAYRNKCEDEAYNTHNPVAKPVTTERFYDTIKFYIDNLNAIRRKKSSREALKYRLTHFLKTERRFCNLFTAKITEDDINAFIHKRSGDITQHSRKISPSTVIREVTELKAVFKYSMRRLRLKESPFDSPYIERPIASEPRDRILSSDEHVKLIEQCIQSTSPWLLPAVNLLLETGMRRGELISMKYSDIDFFDNGNGQVLVRDVKNSRRPHTPINKRIPLSKPAVEVIKILKEKALDDTVFPIRADSLSQMFLRATRKAGIENFHLHDLRHARITALANIRTPISVIQKITGHRDPRSVTRYINPDIEIALEYLNKAEMQIQKK